MTDKRIDAHTNTTTVADVDEFIVDSGSNGTRNITYSNLKTQILGSTSIATIGNSVTEAIYNTYTDIGDLTQTGVTGATVAAQISQLNAEIDDKAKRLNNIKIIDENFEIRFTGVSDVANRILCPIVFPFAFASNDYTLQCSLIDLASVGRFTTGISVNVKDRSSALIILSTTSSAGATYCGAASIHIYRSST